MTAFKVSYIRSLSCVWNLVAIIPVPLYIRISTNINVWLLAWKGLEGCHARRDDCVHESLNHPTQSVVLVTYRNVHVIQFCQTFPVERTNQGLSLTHESEKNGEQSRRFNTGRREKMGGRGATRVSFIHYSIDVICSVRVVCVSIFIHRRHLGS